MVAIETTNFMHRAMDDLLFEAAIEMAPVAKAAMSTEAIMATETAIEPAIAKSAMAFKASVKAVMTTAEATIIKAAMTPAKAAIIKPAMTAIKAAITAKPATPTLEIAATMAAKFAPMMSFKAGFEAAAMVLCYRWKGNNRDRQGRNSAEFGQCAENAHMNTPFMVVALNSRKGSGHCASGLL